MDTRALWRTRLRLGLLAALVALPAIAQTGVDPFQYCRFGAPSWLTKDGRGQAKQVRAEHEKASKALAAELAKPNASEQEISVKRKEVQRLAQRTNEVLTNAVLRPLWQGDRPAIDVEDNVILDFDEDALLAKLGPASPEESAVVGRIAALGRALAEVISLNNSWAAKAAAGWGRPADFAPQRDLATAEQALWRGLGEAGIHDSDPGSVAFARKLNAILDAPGRSSQGAGPPGSPPAPPEGGASTLLAAEYLQMRDAVVQRMAELRRELATLQSQNPTYDLYLKAVAVPKRGGNEYQVPVAGYDDAGPRPHLPYQRWQPVVGTTTIEDLRRIDAVKSAVGANAKEFVAKLGEDLSSLGTKLEAAAKGLLSDLAKLPAEVRSAAATPDHPLKPLLDAEAAVKQMVQRAEQLAEQAKAATGSDADKLALILSGIQLLQTDGRTLVASLEQVWNNHEAIVAALEEATEKEIAESIDRQVASLQTELKGSVLGALAEWLLAAQSTADIQAEVFRLKGRPVGPDSLDTAVLFNTMPAPVRDPGTELTVMAWLVPHDGELDQKARISGSRSFHSEIRSLWGKPATALMLAAPTGTPDRGKAMQPATAYGYFVHLPTDSALSSIDPALGVTLAPLDFTGTQQSEYGVGIGLSAFNDRLWGGYGMNLTTRTGYWYFSFDLGGVFGNAKTRF